MNIKTANQIATLLRDTYGYNADDHDHVVVDDLAEAASMVGFDYDLESSEDMVTLDAACDRALDPGFYGAHDCGVCLKSAPYAVDWGCTCEMTADEAADAARDFARIHD